MSLSDPIKLTEVKKFIDKGKFHEALRLLENLKSKNNLINIKRWLYRNNLISFLL